MADKLTRELAEALCTVIAIGFIDDNNKTVRKTKFIYEKEDEEQAHNDLKKLLDSYGVAIDFTQSNSKHTQPLIVAKKNNTFTSEQLQGIADDFYSICQILETKINNDYKNTYRVKYKTEPPNLRGAYIGGMMDLNKFQLSGPSYLYLYPAIYRKTTISGASDPERQEMNLVRSSYEAAKEASNALLRFLKSESNVKDKKSREGRKLLFLEENAQEIVGDYIPPNLFASCHGMILAMNQYGDFLDKHGACVELALGEKTCKVASCLPCSLFMSANNTPASATHFGRGDNWNLPPKTERRPIMETAWRKKVIDIYNEVVQCSPVCQAEKIIRLQEFMDVNGYDIPAVFLEALTFEGSFVQKIKNTLPLDENRKPR